MANFGPVPLSSCLSAQKTGPHAARRSNICFASLGLSSVGKVLLFVLSLSTNNVDAAGEANERAKPAVIYESHDVLNSDLLTGSEVVKVRFFSINCHGGRGSQPS